MSRIDHLPRNSAFVEAVSQDEEMARLTADDPAPPRADAVRMRDWSPLLEMLTVVADRQAELIQAIIASQGGKPPKIAPLPRPKTAMDKINNPHKQHMRVLSKVMIEQPDGTVISALDANQGRMALPQVPA